MGERGTVRKSERGTGLEAATAANDAAAVTTVTPAARKRDLDLREALRVSREAIAAIERQLDALLGSVRAVNAARGADTAEAAGAASPASTASTVAPPRADAIERLARSTRRADAAVRSLSPSSP